MKLPDLESVPKERLSAVGWLLLAMLIQDQLQRHSDQCSCSLETAVVEVWRVVWKPGT